MATASTLFKFPNAIPSLLIGNRNVDVAYHQVGIVSYRCNISDSAGPIPTLFENFRRTELVEQARSPLAHS